MCWQQAQHSGQPGDTLEPRGPRVTCESIDFSDSGIAIGVAHPLVPGETLLLELERERGSQPVSALGRVAYCRADGATYRVGLELTWIEDTKPESSVGVVPGNAWMVI